MDVKTILVLLIIGHLSTILVIYGYSHKNPTKTLSLYILTQVLFFIAYFLFLIRSLFISPWTIIISNTAIVLAFYAQSATLLNAMNKWNEQIRKKYILFLTPSMLVFYYFSFVKPDENIRVILITALLLLILVYPTLCLIKQQNRSMVHLTITFAYLFSFLSSGVRIINALVSNNGMTFLTPSLNNTLAFINFYLFMIINSIGILLLIKEQDDLKLLEAATFDELTRLYNRRYLLQIFDKTLELHKRNQKPMTIILLDLDHFKKINDTYGHEQGDLVLKIFSETLSQQLRTYDVFSRFGGDEFIFLLPETNVEYGLKIAERVKNEINHLSVNEIKITASQGLYSTVPSADDDFSTFFKRADQALYLSKEAGRDCITVWDKIHIV